MPSGAAVETSRPDVGELLSCFKDRKDSEFAMKLEFHLPEVDFSEVSKNIS